MRLILQLAAIGSSTHLAACSWTLFLHPLSAEIYPEEQILVSVCSAEELAATYRSGEYYLENEKAERFKLRIHPMNTAGHYFALTADQPLLPGEYTIFRSLTPDGKPGPPWINPDFSGRKAALRVTPRTEAEPFGRRDWVPRGVRIEDALCSYRYVELESATTAPATEGSFLVRMTINGEQHFGWVKRHDGRSLHLGSVACPWNLPIDYQSSGRIELFEYRHGLLEPAGAWDYAIPPPKGWTATRYQAFRDCEEKRAAARMRIFSAPAQQVVESPEVIGEQCIQRTGLFEGQTLNQLQQVLPRSSHFTAEECQFKPVPAASAGKALTLAEVVPVKPEPR